MTENKRTKATEPAEVEAVAVKVGDAIEIDKKAEHLALLPDGTVVTCGRTYTIQHAGRHVIGGVEYDATDPRKAADEDVSTEADPEA